MTANLPETPRKHLQNVIAFILACFLSFGPGAYALPVEAEDEGIPIDFFPGFTFKRSSIPSFFDMTAEESLQPVIPADLYIVLLIVPDKGRYMAIPCTGAEYIIVRDKEKDTKTNKKLLESGQAILASELSNSISQGMIDGIGKKKTMLLKALSTDEIVSVGAYVRDPIVGMTLLQCLVSQKYANLLLDDARGPDREKNGYSFAVVSFPEYLKQYCERFPSRDRLIPGDLLKKEVTVGQFIRDMYMKIIPAPLWPAQTTFATQNLSIPELTKTKLQETLAENNIGLGIVLNIDDFPVKIIPYCYDESNGAYIDLFTNRKMDLQGVAAWMSLDMGNPLFEQDFNYSSSLMQHFQAFPKLSNISRHFELKESYSILSGYPGQIEDYNQIFLPMRDTELIDAAKFDRSLAHAWGEYTNLVDQLRDDTTIGELADLYAKLPKEYTIDYTGYDLSGNPHIDPGFLAARPTPAPSPTPAPYAELTVGSRGQEVLNMKQRFYELGYYRTATFNDSFTEKTADTVRLFEKINGLPEDGVADAVMLGVLYSDSAVGK